MTFLMYLEHGRYVDGVWAGWGVEPIQHHGWATVREATQSWRSRSLPSTPYLNGVEYPTSVPGVFQRVWFDPEVTPLFDMEEAQ